MKLLLFALLCMITLNLSGCAFSLLAAKTATTNISMGANMDDVSLYWHLRYLLYKQFHTIKNARIEVSVFNRTAILVGFMPSNKLKRQLTHDLKQVYALRDFYNFITVSPHPPNVNYWQDTLLTTRIKFNFIGKVNPLHFKVVTYNRVAYLLGRCKRKQCNKALLVASETKGIHKVINVLNTIPTHTTPAPIQTIGQ